MPIVPATASSDYAKEPVVVLDKAEALSVGDKVKLNGFYLSFYCGVQALIGVEAEVIKIVSRPISASKLAEDKSDYQRFVSKYGKKETYEVVGLHVRYPNDARVYLVSPFGYDKA